jgi:hypothetical protein
MYLMTTMFFPTEKQVEIMTKYAEFAIKYPLDQYVGKPVFPGGIYSDSEGTHAVSILDVPEGKMQTIINNQYRQMNEFFTDIEGFRFEIKYLLSPEETLASMSGQ